MSVNSESFLIWFFEKFGKNGEIRRPKNDSSFSYVVDLQSNVNLAIIYSNLAMVAGVLLMRKEKHIFNEFTRNYSMVSNNGAVLKRKVLGRPYIIKCGEAFLNWDLDNINLKRENQNLLVHKIGNSGNMFKSKIEQN